MTHRPAPQPCNIMICDKATDMCLEAQQQPPDAHMSNESTDEGNVSKNGREIDTSGALADEITESVEAMQGYFDAALTGEESRAKLFSLWKSQRSVIDSQIARIREREQR